MSLIWLALLYVIFTTTIIWSLWFLVCLVWYYVRLILIIMDRLLCRVSFFQFLVSRNPQKIRIERYYSLFRTPLLFYFSLPFLALLVSSFINDYLLNNFRLEDNVVFVTFALLLVVFWISVYTVFSFSNEKKQIKKTIRAHRQFIKVTMFPVSLLSIVVPIISAMNIVIETEIKQNIISEFSKLDLDSNSILFSLIFLLILVFEGFSLLVMGLLEHILENESEYKYFFNRIMAFFKNLIGTVLTEK